MSIEYLLTATLVVLIPGTGVLYTLMVGLTRGPRASCWAAVGCTLGIVPSLLASVTGLAALIHTSALAFQVLKFAGVCWLLYLAVQMWREADAIEFGEDAGSGDPLRIAVRGVLINALNPKLTIFFLAFIPQFVPVEATQPVLEILILGGVFMAITLLVFIGYGLLASQARRALQAGSASVRRLNRGCALAFAALGARLALAERG